MKRLLLPVLLPLLLTSALAQQTKPPQASRGLGYHPSRVIVRFRGGAQFLPGSGPAKLLSQQLNLHVVDNPPGLSVLEAIGRYKNNPNTVYAEPDYQVHALDTIPSDSMWSQQWDMAKIQAPAAWDKQTFAGDVVVAVVDTGIAYTHPDLQGNIWNDGTGVNGFTCIGGSCVAGGADDFGHGSHVAGTIGAVGNNGLGIAGINWGVKLISLKFLDSTGNGNISDAVAAFNKIAQLKGAGVNIRVTNNSWGGGDYTQSLKDAMANVESLGILNVCAAGNSGSNADVAPMYPAAYDNRGIVSVAASDSNDASPIWTNYGLANVDVAAPGVSTLSTVPTGTCNLCDPSGYKVLSGTSMATPHVAGVAAALFHVSPAANASQMRDILLDPASYDVTSDSRLQATSTGGRLNFYKALTNPKLASPASLTLNNFPTMAPLSDITANGNQQIVLSASASDADPGNVLRFGWAPLTSGNAIFGWMLSNIFPSPPLNTNPYSFSAWPLSRTGFTNYAASVSDGHGGGATASSAVKILPASSPNGPPTGVLSLNTHDVGVNGTVTLNFQLSDPENDTPLYWQAWFLSSNVWGEMCCIANPTSSFDLTFSIAGAYRVSVQGIDPHLNLSQKYSDIVHVGGVSGTPPIALTTVDKLEGPAPLTLNIDMNGSSAPGGTISSYRFYCNDGLKISTTAQNSCTYSSPGNYYLWTTVTDNNGLMDAYKTYITVLPASGQSSPPPPTVSINSPGNGAPISGTTTITASASSSLGVSSVSISAGGTTCTVTMAPYSCSWNTAKVANGSYTITASATDTAGNIGSAGPVNVTVDNTPPSVSITSPANGAKVSGTITVTASAGDNVGVSSVTISAGGTTLCSITTTPYSCSWNTTKVADGSYTITASATDTAGNIGSAGPVNVTVDNTPPSVSITSPANGAKVSGTITVTASASDNVGVSSVTISASGTTLCTTTTTPYSCSWNTTKVANAGYTISATAKDAAGNTTTASIMVTVSNPIPPPTVTFVSPTNGATVTGRYTVQVTASANAPNASLKLIQLFIDGTSVATSTTSPLSYKWNTTKLAKGSHTLKAQATDTLNNTTSVTVSVTVN